MASSLMQIGGAQVQAVASVAQGYANKSAAQYNSDMAMNSANQIEQQTKANVERSQIIDQEKLGAGRTALGASGVATGGSGSDELAQSARNSALNALTEQHAGDVKAYGYEATSRLESFQGNNAVAQGWLGAAATEIGAGNKAFDAGKTTPQTSSSTAGQNGGTNIDSNGSDFRDDTEEDDSEEDDL
jgi:hypothetical protein